MQQQGQGVTQDEYPCDDLGLEQTQSGPEDGDDSSEAEVDRGGKKGRSDREPHEVDDEIVLFKDVVVEQDPARVAHDLEGDSAYHAHEEAPCLVPDPEEDLEHEEEEEDSCVGDVAG